MESCGRAAEEGEEVSVLVKGMEMPKNCNDCPLNYDSIDCMVADIALREKGGGDFLFEHERSSNCPLISIPRHGRLIDADKITEHKYATIPPHRKEYADGKPKSSEEIIAFKFGWNYAIDAIVENAPTIIPASDEDTNVLSKEEGET